MWNAIGFRRESNPSRRICNRRVVPLGHVADCTSQKSNSQNTRSEVFTFWLHRRFNENFGITGWLDTFHSTNVNYKKSIQNKRHVTFYDLEPITEKFPSKNPKENWTRKPLELVAFIFVSCNNFDFRCNKFLAFTVAPAGHCVRAVGRGFDSRRPTGEISDTMSQMAIGRCDVFSEMCCPDAKPRRWTRRLSLASAYTASIMKIGFLNELKRIFVTTESNIERKRTKLEKFGRDPSRLPSTSAKGWFSDKIAHRVFVASNELEDVRVSEHCAMTSRPSHILYCCFRQSSNLCDCYVTNVNVMCTKRRLIVSR